MYYICKNISNILKTFKSNFERVSDSDFSSSESSDVDLVNLRPDPPILLTLGGDDLTFAQNVVLILDGNSEIGAHVRSYLCFLIC